MTPLDGGEEQMLALPYHPANSSRSPSPNYGGGRAHGGGGGRGYSNSRQAGMSRSSSQSRMGGGGGGSNVHSRQSRQSMSSSPQGMLALEYDSRGRSSSPPREVHMDYNDATQRTGLEARFSYASPTLANQPQPQVGSTTATGARFPPELQCKNWLRGHCKRGDRCPLKHANKCHDNHRGGCSDPACPFVHVALCTNARCEGPSNCVYDHVNG